MERLLRFGRKHKLIKELDAIVARNTLLDLLGLAQPSEENVPKEDFDTPPPCWTRWWSLPPPRGLFDGSVPQYRINFETRMMGALMPRESEVCRKFRKLYAKGGPKACHGLVLMICALCPTTSARRKLPRTSSGTRPPLTVSWKLPST